jgi:long-subunit acyl-CoA synthetase (AMP-forming)
MCPVVKAEDIDWKFMGILGSNSHDWCMMEYANIYQGITCVPLYETLDTDSLRFIISQTQLTTIAISPKYLERFLTVKKEDETDQTKTLKNIIYFDK